MCCLEWAIHMDTGAPAATLPRIALSGGGRKRNRRRDRERPGVPLGTGVLHYMSVKAGR